MSPFTEVIVQLIEVLASIGCIAAMIVLAVRLFRF